MKKIILIIALILVSGVIYAGFFSNIKMVQTMSKCTLLTEKTQSTTIPFTIESGWMVIEVELKTKDGKTKKEKFILDSGAPTSLMADFAEKEAYKKKGANVNQVALGEGSAKAKNYMLEEPLIFKIGDMEVLQKHTLVNQAGPLGFDCTGAVGLIGSNLLSKFVVSIDFTHNTLTLNNKEQFDNNSLSGHSYKLPFYPLLMQKNPYISMRLNNEEFDGIFDTGFAGDIMLGVDSTDEKVKSRTDGGVIRHFETYAALANIRGIQKVKGDSWLWPAATFTNEDKLPLAKGNINISKTGKTRLSLTIGINYMRQHDRVVINWKDDNIYFFGKGEIKPKAGGPIEVRLRHLPDEQKFVVGLVDVASSFYKSGLRAGDVVTRINSTVLAGISLANNCDLTAELNRLSSEANSYTVVRDGKEIVINKVAI